MFDGMDWEPSQRTAEIYIARGKQTESFKDDRAEQNSPVDPAMEAQIIQNLEEFMSRSNKTDGVSDIMLHLAIWDAESGHADSQAEDMQVETAPASKRRDRDMRDDEVPLVDTTKKAKIIVQNQDSIKSTPTKRFEQYRPNLTSIEPSIPTLSSVTPQSEISSQTTPYITLPPNHIRLLTILPSSVSTSPIHSTLSTVPLTALPSYEALSYVWGPPVLSTSLLTPHGTIPITPNLHDALTHLRLADRPRTIWADAACIDQANSAERSAQVALMRAIYASADKVLVYLGANPTNQASLAFSVICAIASGGSIDTHPVGQANFYVRGASSAHMPDLPCREGPPPASFRFFWSAVAALFARPWFWRIWCLQEIALARSAMVHWGECAVDWTHVGLAAARLRTSWKEVLGLYELAGVYNAYLMYRLNEHGGYGLEPVRCGFGRLLAFTRGFGCGDDRDRVYGLLGIPTSDTDVQKGEVFVTPDYSKSTNEVYTEVARKILETKGSLSLLLSVQHGGDIDENSGLPSWVPNWSISQTHTLSPALASSVSGGPHAAPKQTRQTYLLDFPTPSTLRVSGTIYCPVTKVLPVYTSKQLAEGNILPPIPEWSSLLQPSSSPNDEQKQHVSLGKAAMTLTAGKTWYMLPQSTSNDYSSLTHEFTAYLSTHDTNPTWKPRDNWSIHIATTSALTGRRIFMLLPQNNYGEDTAAAADKEVWPWGVGPAAMRVGDYVGVLFGFRLPVVLRPVAGQAGVWRFVGECYVHDLMDGRAAAAAVDGPRLGLGTGRDDGTVWLV
jgi:hypothetical protein